MSFVTRTSWSSSFAPKPTGSSISRWRPTRNTIRSRGAPREDLDNFKRKIDAGADSAITQYFFNADSYYHFVDEAAAHGVTVPIVPGIMPIAGFSKLARFSDACGAEIPRWIRRKLESYGDDTASIRAFGLDVVTAMCADLLTHGAPGLHFYTLNQANLTTTIWQRLGL